MTLLKSESKSHQLFCGTLKMIQWEVEMNIY